jgi:hypothetical protein
MYIIWENATLDNGLKDCTSGENYLTSWMPSAPVKHTHAHTPPLSFVKYTALYKLQH